MINKILLLTIDLLKQHEKTQNYRLKDLCKKIRKSEVFKEPIIVDKKSLVVLDGHHRLNSCLQLGLNKIPCLMVDYLNDSKIKVISRRKRFKINKNIVLKKGLSNQVFPYKTTKHYIPYRVKNLKIPLSLLN